MIYWYFKSEKVSTPNTITYNVFRIVIQTDLVKIFIFKINDWWVSVKSYVNNLTYCNNGEGKMLTTLSDLVVRFFGIKSYVKSNGK